MIRELCGACNGLIREDGHCPCSLRLNARRLAEAPVIRAIWCEGPDSEAARAARGEGQGAVWERAYERGFVHGFNDGWSSTKEDDESEGE